MDDGENCIAMCHWAAVTVVKIVCFILCDFYHNKKNLKRILHA